MSDFSVVYYYTEGQKYVATHQPSFCQAMLEGATNDAERACAVGACLHQTQDMESHNDMVTYAITHTGLTNAIIHTFAEQHLDNIVQDMAPGIREQALDVDRWNECKPLLKKVLSGVDIYKTDIQDGTFDRVFDKFLDEVSNSVTSYDPNFKRNGLFGNIKVIPPLILGIYIFFMALWLLLTVLLIFKKEKKVINYFAIPFFLVLFLIMGYVFYANTQGNAFQTFINFISPISNIVPIGDVQAHLNIAFENGRQFFVQGERFLIGTDASGFASLNEADSKVFLLDIAVFGGLAVLLLWFIYINFKRKKRHY